MSYFTGTATNYADLMKKVHGHLTADLALAERWIVNRFYGWVDVTASSHLDGNEPDKGVSSSTAEEWATAQGSMAGAWLAVQLIAAYDVTQFAITGASTYTRSPVGFDLQYSDDGTTWTTLQSYTGQAWTNSQRKVFTVTATSVGAKSYWRILFVTLGTNTSYAGFTRWEILETVSGLVTYNHCDAAQLMAQGPDNAGGQYPFVGLQLYRSTTSDIYNWRSVLAKGYNPSAAFNTQPGTSAVLGTPLWNGAIDYHLTANGRRFVLVAVFGGVYETIYAGLHLRRRTPGQFPYPGVLIASLTSDALTRYSDTARVSGWKGSRVNCAANSQANTWVNPAIWPYNNGITRRDSNGNYPLQPLVLHSSDGIFGELEGMFHVSGFSNVAGNTITDGATVQYLVVPDIARADLNQYCAVRLN
jgi:hypothetical protein